MSDKFIKVIGAGLAGAETAWQLAKRNIPVKLFEMRPDKNTPAHQTDKFAELVCSNSLRSTALENAVGLLKEEMRLLGSLVMESADRHRVPAGGALAVDRQGFAQYITGKLANHPMIEIVRQEVTALNPDIITIVASGPLTSTHLAQHLKEMLGDAYLYFYDAAAPIVTLESLNLDVIFRGSRYGKGEAAYLNCPMDEEEYNIFYQALINAQQAPLQEFEQQKHFEGCLPVEVLAGRGLETLLFGALKPVGLTDPRTDKRPHGVVQLRQDNAEGTLYNMVGFQTNLKWGEQKRVFRLIPGMEEAEFVRYGVMHRNTFINSPRLLRPTMQWRQQDKLLFAGQLTGVEGYVESAAAGIVAGINAARLFQGRQPLTFPQATAHGALLHYITSAQAKKFQPMNITFGLIPPLEVRVRNKKERNKQIAERALECLAEFIQKAGI